MEKEHVISVVITDEALLQLVREHFDKVAALIDDIRFQREKGHQEALREIRDGYER